ncbi:tryptophan--tRNA ligase [Carboxydochorda subterranea]|uniref:Tryptophan--tRNA ligase n=1 Tax=Carboxydichorda subterranea TaxID=3109565 RepID=A0ABZ1BYK8_9FIRM|nr:tryptophan--tRNA ligase [Limnochorda sp. L945t]WRP17685.1 tryptophan--tRNA ligase [Limnochorda sp. L945t]
MSTHTVFSGIQPSGGIHVGNLLGALRNWVSLQDQYPCYFCIVDYHAITVPYDPRELPQRVRDAVLVNVAAGLDPNRSVIFVQSQVPQHTELAWLFNCITPLGQLQRMTQFKDKARQHAEAVNAGLLNYPVLQAADILLYKADLVPVGEDQVQHIELTRDIARRFNSLFGPTFPEPEAYLAKGARIMALDDPTRKMSKSEPRGAIGMLDPPEVIREKVRSAVTDPGPAGAEMSPGVLNLFTLLELTAPADVVAHFRAAYSDGTIRYVELKQALADALVELVTPIQERYRELSARPGTVEEVLAAGGERARKVASQVLAEVRDRMGLPVWASVAGR